jgi:hypothetical protein
VIRHDDVTRDDVDTWDVCHVFSNFWAFGTLKSRLERDTCHPPDWATCPLPTFLHVATDHAVQKTGHSRREGGDRLVGSKTPEGPKARVYIDRRFQRTRVEGSLTAGKTTQEKVQEGSLKLLKPETLK